MLREVSGNDGEQTIMFGIEQYVRQLLWLWCGARG